MQLLEDVKLEHKNARADAVVVWCSDPRARKAMLQFASWRQWHDYIQVEIGGGAKVCSSSFIDELRAYFLGQIEFFVKAFHASEVVLMMHEDCRAHNHERDQEALRHELRKGKRVVHDTLMGAKLEEVKICLVLLTFEGAEVFY